MKKLIKSMFALAVAVFGFSSCEDVPMPYSLTYDENGNKTETPEQVAKGTGTKDDPFNIAGAINYINKGQNLDKEVYVKGKIVSIKEINTQFGNATYYISEDGTTANQFFVFRGNALGNKKFKSQDEIKPGDEVIICGKLMTHTNGVKQLGQYNYIYSLNGKTAEGGSTGGTSTVTPAGEGTEASPYNVAKAQEVIKTATTLPTEKEVYVSGIISEIKSFDLKQYGSAEYYISDDGKTPGQLLIYHGKYLNGTKFTAENQIKVGDKVVVKGKLNNFKGNSPQVQFGALVSINGNGGGTTTKPTGDVLNVPFDKDMGNFTVVDKTKPAEVEKIWTLDKKYKQVKATGSIKNASGKYIKYATESRLQSPEFSLAGRTSATLTFSHTAQFFKNFDANMKVQVSTDGINWTDLAIEKKPTGGKKDNKLDWTFVNATIDLTPYAGKSKVYISFLYTSTTASAPTWEIRNVVVK